MVLLSSHAFLGFSIIQLMVSLIILEDAGFVGVKVWSPSHWYRFCSIPWTHVLATNGLPAFFSTVFLFHHSIANTLFLQAVPLKWRKSIVIECATGMIKENETPSLMMLIFQNRGLSAIINYPTVFHFFFIVIAYFDVLYFSLKPTSPLHSRNALPDPFSFHEWAWMMGSLTVLRHKKERSCDLHLNKLFLVWIESLYTEI